MQATEERTMMHGPIGLCLAQLMETKQVPIAFASSSRDDHRESRGEMVMGRAAGGRAAATLLRVPVNLEDNPASILQKEVSLP